MCIVFFWQSSAFDQLGYRLILVNNRDEIWTRPTREAHFWGPRNSCISGVDMHPGKEGGTWLGMNKDGKIGILLNILGKVDLHKRGRGPMVTDYISKDWNIGDYAAKIYKEKCEYNGFNLLLLNAGNQHDYRPTKPMFVTSAPEYPSYNDIGRLPLNTCIGVSNSPLEQPFQKVLKGRERFQNILAKHPTVQTKKELVVDLMDLMADRSSTLPDSVMESAASKRGINDANLPRRSAINVWSPTEQYGSRTTTVILVDGRGQVDYIERTFDLLKPEGVPNQTTVHRTFKLPSLHQVTRPAL